MNSCYFVFVIAACVDVAMAGEANRCCQSGFFMQHNRTADLVYCKHNVTGEKAPLVLDCEKSTMVNEEQQHFNVTDGKIIIWEKWGPIEAIGSCIGEARARKIETNELVHIKVLGSCLVETEEADRDHHAKMGYLLCVSTVFLYLTAVIYAALPELRDLQGKSIVNLCISLGTGFLMFVLQKITDAPEYESPECLVRAIASYFFVIAAFFWMNAISIQIYRSIRRSATADCGWKEFSWYFLYAWGMAGAFSVLVVVLDQIEGPHIKPGIGRNSCWFHTRKEIWAFLYSVLVIIIVFNLAIFCYVFKIVMGSSFKSDHVKNLRYKACLIFGLFLIMGITWVFEIISGTVKKHIITVIFDIVNGLLGVLYFLVLVLLRLRAVKALHKRGFFCCLSPWVESIIARTHDREADAIVHTAITLDDKN